MRVSVNVVQSGELYDAIAPSFGARDGWAVRFIAAHGMTCRLGFSAGDLCPEDLLCFPDAPTVIVAEVPDLASLNRFSALTQRLQALLSENDGVPLLTAPFIAVFRPGALATPNYDIPTFVSDWMLGRVDPVELTHRILCALRKRKLRRIELQGGVIIVLADSRALFYGQNCVRLSPTEFALAELFFARMGSVVSLAELTALFEASGKSTELNNIRVTIHQLRLKLEELTRSQLKLVTIYRKGYCLRHYARQALAPRDGHAWGDEPTKLIIPNGC